MTTRSRFTRLRTSRLAACALVLLTGLTIVVSTTACEGIEGKSARLAAGSEKKTLYRCPMHPEYVSDHPGDCPICGMRLVPFEPQSTPAGPATPAPAKPATPATTGAPAGAGQPSADPHRHDAGSTSPSTVAPAAVPAVMTLGPERARLAGVRSVAAARGRLSRTIRAVGTVAIDETRVREVTTKVAGFVEKLYVNATGQLVRAGQPLFDLYSPELLATQEEYVRARQSAAEFQRSSLPEVQRGGAELASAARRRLELLDVPPEFIARLDETGKAQRTITFRAPFAGYVTGKNVLAGQRIEPGADLLTVTDLSHVWVMAQVYEAEAAAAQPGRSAVVTLPYDEGVKLSGRIGFVYPTLETETRTLKVRLEFGNPRGRLKPGMFVNVELPTEQGSGIVVPDSAVLDTGTRHVVFVETAPGVFATREVGLAFRADGQALLRSGVKPGEQVAVSANFLLDSESRLRSAAQATGHQHQEP